MVMKVVTTQYLRKPSTQIKVVHIQGPLTANQIPGHSHMVTRFSLPLPSFNTKAYK